MSARDDYPWLANRERGWAAEPDRCPERFNREIGPALDEIDRLRASSCTPAERALIDAALALRNAHYGHRAACATADSDLVVVEATRLGDAWEASIVAADAVLAERGEA